jgi:hypothetical protein
MVSTLLSQMGALKSRILLSILLAFLFSFQLAAQSNMLKKKIDFSVQDERLEDILFQIADIGGFSFSYNTALLPIDSIITLNVKESTINDVLKVLLGQELELKISGNHMVILKTKFSSSLTSKSSSGGHQKQSVTIEGYVRNSDVGTYVPLVTVYDVDGLNSAMTDSVGFFSLEVSTSKRYLGLAFLRTEFQDTAIVINSNSQRVDMEIKPVASQGVSSSINYDATGSSKVNALKVVSIVAPRQSIESAGNKSIYIRRFGQVSFLPFLGTNLFMSGMAENRVSVNILAGYNGAVRGFELGGLVNINRHYTYGVQAAGIMNVVGEETNGLQLSGILNTNLGTVRGAQIAGVNNFVLDSLKGLQLSGINNIIVGKLLGLQLAGISNIATQDVDGVQLAGVTNVAFKDINRVQLAGVANYGRNISGTQIAGVINTSKSIANGVQIAGIGNFTLNDNKGAQIGLVFNYARKNNGLQLSLINVADSVSGVSIGLINLVRKGYNKLEVSANEILYYNAKVKFGAQNFYTIIAFGAQGFGKGEIWGYTYGFGGAIPLSKKRKVELDIELTATDLQDDNTWFEERNINSRLNFHFSYRINKFISVFGGPSWCNLIYPGDYESSAPYIPDLIPYSLYHKTYGNSEVDGWIGGEVGIRLF